MNKGLYIVISLLWVSTIYGQNQEEVAIKKVISTLFEAMQKTDTLTMRSCFDIDARLQTALSNTKNKTTKLVTESIDSFLMQVSKIPTDSLHIEEHITDYKIQIDLPMASVWASYNFYINGKISHTGVDAFQLFKSAAGWKIIQLCDTRKKK